MNTCTSTTKPTLIANLRRQLEALNDYAFTDSEWTRFFRDCIAGANDGIVEKTRRIQHDHVQVLRQDSGASKNIYLLDKKHIHNNRLQVLHQYEESAGSHRHALRRDRPRQRPAAGTYRAQAARRGHPRGVQPDQALPARQLLGGKRPV